MFKNILVSRAVRSVVSRSFATQRLTAEQVKSQLQTIK